MQVTLTVTYWNGEHTISAHPSHELAVAALAELANVAHVVRIQRIELAFAVPSQTRPVVSGRP